METIPRFQPYKKKTLCMQESLRMLKDNNTDILTITGEPGIGKTERALQICHYMGERNEFCSIFFAQCRDAVAYQRSIPPSGEQQTHIGRFCKLVSGAHFNSSASCSPWNLDPSLNTRRRFRRGSTVSCT